MLGLSVTVFEALERPLARVASPAISHFIAAAHRAAGVSIRLSTTLERFEGGDRLTGLRAGGELYPADVALVGIGAIPNCELAQTAGLATDDGIVVDQFTRTSDPLIFAAGDCTRHPGAHGGLLRLESVQNAVDQARHAALAMLDRPRCYAQTPWFWSDQFEIKLQMAGLPRADDRVVVRGDSNSNRFSVFHLRGEQISAVEAVNSAPDYMAGRKLIAAGKKIAAERLMDIGMPVKSLL
jgi:3-phenylpropionate/trans-cinnamate dioxygenase ferredoxin reductase subunit